MTACEHAPLCYRLFLLIWQLFPTRGGSFSSTLVLGDGGAANLFSTSTTLSCVSMPPVGDIVANGLISADRNPLQLHWKL